MEFILSSKEMKEADQYTIVSYYSSLELMERAGRSIFEFIKTNFSKGFYYLIVTGSGNNGGDGFVLARYLLENGYKVDVYEVSKARSEEATQNKNKYLKETINELNINKNTIVIDSIFGYGLNKNIEEPYLSVIKKINESEKYKVISVDIASGISASNGKKLNEAIKSDITLALGEYKLGHFLNDGKDYNKLTIKLDIGITLPKKDYIKRLNKEDFKDLFINRKENSNKGTYGKVTLLGGMEKTPGALILAYKAYISLKLGAGYSELAFPRSLKFLYSSLTPEIIYHPLKDRKDGRIKFNKKELDTMLNSKVITIGMGIGVSKDVYKIIKYLLKNYKNNLIIDADGLNSLAKYGVDILKEKRECNVILTPHIKEFSRLSKRSVDEIKETRVKFSKEFSYLYNVYLVLKDNSTLIVYKNDAYLNTNGNSGLAKGGSGDLLSGLIAGSISLNNKKEDLLRKITLGSYILGRSADILKLHERVNEFSLIPSEVLNVVNKVINEILG